MQLEDEFTSLLQGAAADTQKAFSSEMAQLKRQRLEESASSPDDDSSLVPEDYESDEERKGDETEDEDDTCHVTKVCHGNLFNFFFLLFFLLSEMTIGLGRLVSWCFEPSRGAGGGIRIHCENRNPMTGMEPLASN